MREIGHGWKLPVLIIGLAIILLAISVYPGKTTFAGSHTMHKNTTSASYGAAEFCNKCHPEIVANLSTSAAHNLSVTGCICHGYAPNLTDSLRHINLKHNLTKNIYCTNCHTDYNSTGGLPISGGGGTINVPNQSGHYIYFNESDATEMEKLYNRSRTYFENNTF